ncbi:hypothetical protein [Streptococcus dysgalactiae]|uniref:hypothetical protein n=1 Tax=Streptococcus dysgalactiae TaxID=1334 RepID=UPI0024B78C25|nr:hypothetical protein [Streptococcus dysgalactiae]
MINRKSRLRVATLLVVSGPKFCGETAPLITFRQISYQVAPRYLLSAVARSIRAMVCYNYGVCKRRALVSYGD